MIFVLALDPGFLMPTGVAIRSLDRFLGRQDTVAVLHLGLTAEHQAKLQQCVANASIRFFNCDGLLRRSWQPPDHVTSAAFLRYLAPELLSSEQRCVYVDGDVLVRSDPAELFATDLAGRTVGAVRSRVAPYFASKGAVGAWREAGLPGAAPYFNSGVLVMDLKRWRERRITDSLTTYLDLHGDRAWLADQEALNVAVVGDWTPIDRKWNYITYVADYFLQMPESEPENPALVHFAGRAKPWVAGRSPLYADEWFDILQETPWRGHTPEQGPQPSGVRARMRRVVAGGLRSLRSLLDEP